MKQVIGLHFRVTPSLSEVLRQARDLEVPVIQTFLLHQDTGNHLVADEVMCDAVKDLMATFTKRYAHAAYWINLASGASLGGQHILKKELALAQQLGYDAVILHPGSAVGYETKQEGIDAVARRLNRIHARISMPIILENTAHGNLAVGSSLQDLAAIKAQLKKPELVTFCIDTAHAHAFGYDIVRPGGLERFIEELDAALGLDTVELIHFNDSYEHFNTKRDRHAIPGLGTIGAVAMKALLNHPRLRNKYFLIELPPMSLDQQRAIMQEMRAWCQEE